MKYVESRELEKLSSMLCNCVADYRIIGGIELFTTKFATSDRRLIRTLDRQLENRGANEDDEEALEIIDSNLYGTSAGSFRPAPVLLLSPPTNTEPKRRANSATLASSPFGPLDQGSSRKQYAYLISVLNASDPDRDFSALQPDNFVREYNAGKAMHSFDNALIGLGQTCPPRFWEAINREIDIRNSKIYTLVLPQQFLQDDEPGTFWFKMWFFFNKRQKRVVFLYLKTCRLYPADQKPLAANDCDGLLGDEAVLGNLEPS